MAEIFQIGSITGSIIAILLFLAYISQDYYDVESLTISSLTLRYFPGELQDVQNSPVVEIEDSKENLSSQNDFIIENKDDFHEKYEQERIDEGTEIKHESDEERFERIGKRQQERIENLKKFCQANLNLRFTKATIWFSALYEKTLVCLNPKAGSTNLMSFLYYLTNKKPFPADGLKDDMHEAVKKYEMSLPTVRSQLTALSAKRTGLDEILTVRDPLYRFLASWRDKIETEEYSTYKHRSKRDTFFYYQKITTPVLISKGLKWVKNAEDFNKEKIKDPMFGLSFCDYVDYYSVTVGQGGRNRPDFHLEEQWKNCGVCSADYKTKFIGKTETYDEDLWWLFTKFDFDPPENTQSSEMNAHRTNTDSEMLKDYFSTCAKTNVENLIKKYKRDYQAFGYKPEYSELGIKIVF